jgi:hypothetical protein
MSNSNFKELISTTGASIHVNMDAVAYLYPGQGHTTVYFAVADAGKLPSVGVKEPPDAIAAASPGSASPAFRPLGQPAQPAASGR